MRGCAQLTGRLGKGRALRQIWLMTGLISSVRLRLLGLVMIPLVVVLPLLLLVGMARWSDQFDRLLILTVQSDLKIAQGYLNRILSGTTRDLNALARSVDLHDAADGSAEGFALKLEEYRAALGLDFLYLIAPADLPQATRKWPVIAEAALGASRTVIDLFDPADLAALSPALATRASIPLVATQAALPTTRQIEDRGLVIHSATAISSGARQGVLVGGTLLNRNLGFIDTINNLVYSAPNQGGQRQGTATLFLEDVRVSTNVRLFEDVRALGTRVSAEVRQRVLDNGETWLDRAFVVNDWYISGYLPLTDSFGRAVGMLYVGFLEAPFLATKRRAYITILGTVFVVLGATVPLFFWLARGVFAPLETMTRTMRKVEAGDLDARIGDISRHDEIGEVAMHLDTLLDQISERDHKLRAWADELNDRVERRTDELRRANAKLEATFQQLVLSEKLASIGEITAGVAHEINNPVAVIQGNVDVMRETLGQNAGEVTTELNLIDRQVMRISSIVGKLLQFARPGEFSGTSATCDPAQVLRDCLVLVEHEMRNREIEIVTDLRPTPPVTIDQGELQQVVINLLINARQAMGDHGRLSLTIRTGRSGRKDGVAIIVADTGPGVPRDKIDAVFDPFFTTRLGEGTGLGLSISQTLITRAGGTIGLRNRAPHGAEFTIWLPV